ncbi:uncharacterized protein LOC134099088 [Sardina pilchardus]|uniref:uncharacterized protein LOC134099088 n=1 Tax=Sardina pilchardus TaxID=27697 RepID=UPI002E1668B7
MLCVALLLVQLAFAAQGQNASSLSSSSSASSSSSSLRQSEMFLEPQSLVVLTGQSARFNCSTTAPWTLMMCRLDDTTVMAISAENGPQNTPSSYTAENCSTAEMSCWGLVIERVIRSNSTQPHQLVCEILDGPKMTAELHIQENGSVVVTGGNTSVASGQMVEFQCEAIGWFPEPSVEWLLSGQPVSRDSFNTSSELDRTRVPLYSTTSTLVLEARRGGSVECRASVSAMAAPLSASTSLSVLQVKDDTAVIAAVSCVAAMLLIILIAVCITLYLRRRGLRKESSIPGTERIEHRSQQNSVAEETEGRENAGYSSEGSSSFVDTETSVSVHSRRTSASTEEASATKEMPDVVPSLYNTIYYISLGDKSIKIPRSVTTV